MAEQRIWPWASQVPDYTIYHWTILPLPCGTSICVAPLVSAVKCSPGTGIPVSFWSGLALALPLLLVPVGGLQKALSTNRSSGCEKMENLVYGRGWGQGCTVNLMGQRNGNTSVGREGSSVGTNERSLTSTSPGQGGWCGILSLKTPGWRKWRG